MNQSTFYVATSIGLIISGLLMHFVNHFRLSIIVPGLIIGAFVIVGIGIWFYRFKLKR